ncbi:hypothetical protein [Dielma fastidiosa]|uniref:hypothetical protein n=1 Tax=Dielma fastidiosa TaxID=1034346 RepID=UPI000E526887|nr:hypothetical protein [Dielma fastidiosa]RHN01730.1 hypothetical protein DWZ33_06980 [Dielma fastidiosa]
MNKYSSKAVKTAATVGMSLAMVLSAVPAVGNATVAQAAIKDVVSARTTATEAQKVLAAVLDEITDYADLFGKTVLATDKTEIKISDAKNYYVTIPANAEFSTLKDLVVTSQEDSTTDEVVRNGIGDATKLEEIAKYLVANSYAMDDADIDEDVIAFAKFIKGYKEATDKLGNYFDADGAFINEGTTVIKEIAENGYTKDTDTDKAEEIYKIIKDNEKYLNAVVKTDADKDLINDFRAEVEDYKGENEDVYNKEYVKELEDTPLVGDVTVYDAVEKGAAISYTKLATVEKVLKNIKNDDVTKLADIADYDDVKDSEEVANYIEGLETIVSEMKEVKALLKSTNDDVKSYKKDLASKVNKLADAANAYLTDDGKDTVKTEEKETALNAALNAFREADATALKNFVEDFIGEFYTLTPKQLNSGKYVVRLENADYGRYVETKDVFGLFEKTTDKGLEYLLTTVIDNEESEETYYDTVINAVTTVEELLKAVTDDIEGLTLNSTLTSAQANKIIKAKKALNQLVNKNGKIESEYANALTSKEKKAVLANQELIETLYLKLILNGTVTQSGWVDKGNGDWDYIAEDGSRPSKWIASGANWYYVKNGTMLRNSWIASDAQGTRWYYVDDNGVMVSNTTVNGYTFNSYGVWVK